MSKITTIRKVKQDDKFSIAIRDIQSQHPANKKCFDCDQRGPTYVNMTIGSFVCTKCSGMLRGINPPHRIKSISMSSFTHDEVEMMRNKGNAWCAAVWLGNYNKNTNPVDFKDDEKIKDFIVAKYEKKRYYVDPAQANLSSIKQQLTGGSTGSSDSHNSHKHVTSSFIGSTIKARGESSWGAAVSHNSFVVSRPEHNNSGGNLTQHVSQLPPHVSANMHVSQTVATGQNSVTNNNGHAAPASAAPVKQNNFADFANFDTAAFDSLPPDPLTNPPPSSTLPPMNRKPSTGLSAPIGQNSADNNQSQAPVSSKSSGDKYSALAELDDLFRSTTVDSPAPAPQTHDHSAVSTGLFSSSAKPVPNMFVSESPAAGGVGSPAGAWAPGRVSPAAAWSTSSAGRAASPGGWGSNTGNTSPMWTPHFGGDNTGGGPGLIPPQSTNPFGTSPSNPPPMMGTMFPTDNNNDLFAAAPKPFGSDKSGLVNSGNPWSMSVSSPAAPASSSAGSFTSSMTPAHNPNNPFL